MCTTCLFSESMADSEAIEIVSSLFRQTAQPQLLLVTHSKPFLSLDTLSKPSLSLDTHSKPTIPRLGTYSKPSLSLDRYLLTVILPSHWILTANLASHWTRSKSPLALGTLSQPSLSLHSFFPLETKMMSPLFSQRKHCIAHGGIRTCDFRIMTTLYH